jgi:cell division protein FtsZ
LWLSKSEINRETKPDNPVAIKVIGVGGAGINALNNMAEHGMKGVELIAVSTDKSELSKSKADVKLLIGQTIMGGIGANSTPERGRAAAEESRGEIAKALENAPLVFIVAGMGGGTGTGAAPVIADIVCKRITIGLVTKPFELEGARREKQAEDGINALLPKVDALLVIPNEKLKSVGEQKNTLNIAFAAADDAIRQAVAFISDIAMNAYEHINMNITFLPRIFQDSVYIYMGIGEADSKEEAARKAVAGPLMENSINNACGIIIGIAGSHDLEFEDVKKAASIVCEAANDNVNILLGARCDRAMGDKFRVEVIVTRRDGAMPAKHIQPNPQIKQKNDPVDTIFKIFQSDTASAESGGAPLAKQMRPAPAVKQKKDPVDTIFKIFNSK